jgi:gliding motility-associated-like protein
MNSSPGCCRLLRVWQNTLLSLTCAAIAFFCLVYSPAHGQNNVAPQIVGQQPLSVSAGDPLSITLEDLNVVDPDNSYPDEFTLRLLENSEVLELSGNNIISDPQFEGSLEVMVVVNDGISDSDPFTLTVDVIGTNGKGKAGEENKGGGKDQGDKAGDKKNEEKKGGENKGEEKGGGKKDEGKPGEDKGGEKKDDKGGDKKDDKGGEKKDDEKKEKDDKGGGKNQDEDKGGGKNDDGKGKGNNGEGKDEGENKGGDKKDEGNKGGDKKDDGKNQGEDKGGNNGGNSGGNNGNANTPPPSNVAPIITGQHEISTARNVAIDLNLNMLRVDDPDNSYPNDFSLRVFEGNNYALDGTRVIPGQDFTGTLDVRVQVNDGISNSNTFTLKITVKEGNIPPLILGQSPLATDEETPLAIEFDNLIVFDPDSPYPNGFTINISNGEHHNVEGRTIQPHENFYGHLSVMVTVQDGKLESEPFPLQITVNPVNDVPVLENLEREVIQYLANAGPAGITDHIRITEVDDENIVGAEISFDRATYQSDHDLLSYEPTGQDPINAIFDPESGTLFLMGSASASDYQTALRSVAYSFYHENLETVGATTKTLSIVVRDGQSESNVVTRDIAFSSEIALDVPRAFTPNGDMANDTWSVKPIQNAEDYEDAITRIYTIRGELLYEASGFEWEWDGRYQGQYLPTGTYYYIISIRSGLNMSNRKGVVTILR